jgi:pimeloyl-ACP methyl ester carboxylesterase
MTGYTTERRSIDGVVIDLVRGGSGKQLLFLHSVDGVRTDTSFLERLAERFQVIAPWHPGFGHSELPADFRTVGDLAFFYLQLIDELAIDDAVLVGTSFGGWLAAEIAIRSCRAFSHAVLLDPLGIKAGGRESRDIADVFACSQDDLTRLAYFDPANRARDYSAMSDDELLSIARSREAYAYFGWRPYMHDPSLRRWLRRIHIPTLVMWGSHDGIVGKDYGRAFAAEIPDTEFVLVDEAGHYPHLERPRLVVDLLVDFVARTASHADLATMAPARS